MLVTSMVIVIVVVVGHVKLRPVKSGSGATGFIGIEQRDGLRAQPRATDLAEDIVESIGRLGTRQGDVEIVHLEDYKPEVLAREPCRYIFWPLSSRIPASNMIF